MQLEDSAYSNTRQSSRSPNHSVQPGHYTVQVATTESEIARVRGRLCLHPLDEDTQDPSRTRADSQCRNEDTCWNFDTEGDDGQTSLDNKSNEESVDDG